MWMMGCNDGSEFNMPSADSFNGGRKLRPLIPMPLPSSATNTNPCHGNRIHSTTDFFLLNQHLATVAEQNKRELMMNSTQQVAVSSRWNPTSEQLQTLEELYRRGTRTPSADQIQHITAQLRQYGKIEGKNVFYWFQNHKARERQKRRRQTAEPDNHQPRHIEILERKETEANRTGYDEVEQTKNWVPSTNWSTLAEESVVSRQRAAKAAAMAECRTDGWIQVEEGELQQRRGLVERNGTWQMMQLSCPPHTHLITTSTTAATTRPTGPTGPTITSTAAAAVTTMDPKLFFIAPYTSSEAINNGLLDPEDELCGESQTLELFPLRSSQGNNQKEVTDLSVSAMDSDFTTPNYQFFEFLPLKN